MHAHIESIYQHGSGGGLCLSGDAVAGWLAGRVGGDAAGVLLRSAVHDAVANTDK